MAVGQEQPANLVAVFANECEIGDDGVDPQVGVLGEHLAAVDDYDLVTPAQCQGVHTELAKSAQRYHLQLRVVHAQSVSSLQLRDSLTAVLESQGDGSGFMRANQEKWEKRINKILCERSVPPWPG